LLTLKSKLREKGYNVYKSSLISGPVVFKIENDPLKQRIEHGEVLTLEFMQGLA